MGIVVFLGIAVISATLWHRFVTGYASATIGATLTTVVLFQVAAYVHAGQLDKFFIIALVTTSAMALIISALLGLPLRARRKREREGLSSRGDR